MQRSLSGYRHLIYCINSARENSNIIFTASFWTERDAFENNTKNQHCRGAREKSAWTSLMNFIISPAEVDFLVAMCKYGDLDMDMSLAAGPALCVSPDLCFYSRTWKFLSDAFSHRAWIDFRRAGSFFLIWETSWPLDAALCAQTVWIWDDLTAWSTRQFNSRVTRGATFCWPSIKFPIKQSLRVNWISRF